MRPAPPLLVAGLSLIVLAGCGVSSGSTGSAASSPSPTGTRSGSPSSSGTPTGSATADGSGTATAASELGQPVATRTAQRDGFSLVLTVYPVTRDSGVSTLNVTVRATTAREGSRFQLGGLLTDADPSSGDSSGDAADGITLIDGAHGKAYLVASDGSGHCLCSRDLVGSFLDDGETTTLNATFAAPPAGVDAVTVTFPTFGSVPDVPVR